MRRRWATLRRADCRRQARQLAQVRGNVIMDEAMMQALLETYLRGLGCSNGSGSGRDGSGSLSRRRGVSVVRLLVCDDAPQFTLVTEELALCWVYEGRHYKKLMLCISYH